jgi:hypothetical protein
VKVRGTSQAKGDTSRWAGWGPWLTALAGGVLLVFAPSSAMLGSMLLLPTALAWIGDKKPSRPTARVVLLFGLTAACAPFDAFWQAGDRPAADLALSADVRLVAIAWSAQAGGWLLTQLLPLLISTWADAQAETQIKLFANRKAELLEEWIDPV